jgi:hypothetical protein
MEVTRINKKKTDKEALKSDMDRVTKSGVPVRRLKDATNIDPETGVEIVKPDEFDLYLIRSYESLPKSQRTYTHDELKAKYGIK